MRTHVLVTAAVLTLASGRTPAAAQPLTGTIAGTAVYSAEPGLKIVGARVFIPGTQYLTTTDSTGSFAFFDVPDGRYRIEVSVETFPGFAMLEARPSPNGSVRRLSIAWAPSGERDPADIAAAFTRLPPPAPTRNVSLAPATAPSPAPLLVIDDKMFIWPVQKDLSSIQSDQVLNIKVLKVLQPASPNSSVLRFGPLGMQGAILITTKAATPR